MSVQALIKQITAYIEHWNFDGFVIIPKQRSI